jgi:hypothetical protein
MKFLGSIIFPSTLRAFPEFSLIWATLASFGYSILLLLERTQGFLIPNYLIFCLLTLGGFVVSFRFPELRENKNNFKFGQSQIAKSIPAAIVILLLLLCPNIVSIDNPRIAGLAIAFLGFWSTQLAVGMRLICQHFHMANPS